MGNYNVIVIGGGPGGYEAAIRLSQYGISCLLIEKERLGGVCLNRGCIPTKALVKSAELYREMREAEVYGLPATDIHLDYAQVFERKNKIVEQLVGGIEFLYRKRKIALHHSAVTEIIKHQDAFEVKTADDQSFKSKFVIIATGSTAKSLRGITIDEQDIMSSTGILQMDSLPESLAIVGGGVIGCEFASIYAAFGVKVSIIEFLPRLVALEDEEISKRLALALKKSGIKVMTNTAVHSIEKDGKEMLLKLGNESELRAEKVLLSVGRLPSYDIQSTGFDLKTDKGAISIDELMRTSEPGIYAIGDVTAKLQLAHTASKQGLLAAGHIAHLLKGTTARTCGLEYVNIPRCTFTNPEIGSVGYNEADAKEKFGEIIIGKFPFSASGKAMSMSATQGFVKTIARKDNGELVGMHIMGTGAAELIAQGAIMISGHMTAESIEDIVFAHPTLSEAIMESVEDLRELSIHKI
ncbi:MAG: dihydrolipoyl dehydrogenase [Candidatus Cloacimonetes bacterium]|nr:dihydrolipoyl dehydrogenase [Candidatus Cloacimonadota bacterium]MDD2505705.1 dihydrolipoyl dehydrogenase [Candidatus Cloacimonadota bacterium]MDD4559127.1 dihydrolipoyl dehydrogenase [Candidatus Cloacimonadota bacterium]